MSKDFSDIPTDLVTIKDAAAVLSAHDDQTSAQNLGRYCKRHSLIEKKHGRLLMVNPRRVADHRDNFTREVMSGEHLKSKNITPQKKKPKKLAVVKSVTSATNAKTKPKTAEVESLDRARLAKAEKEEAQADRARLELFKETRDLIATAEFEVLLGLLMVLIKETLFGVNLSDDTDAILAVNNLPDARKKPTMAILKSRRRDLSQSLADLAAREMSILDPDHATGYQTRMEKIIEDIQTLRTAEFKTRIGANKAPA